MKRIVVCFVIVLYAAVAVDAQEKQDRVESGKRMARLGSVLAVYLNDHEGKYPGALRELKGWGLSEGDLDWLLDNVEYLGQGRTGAEPHDTIIAYDTTGLREDDHTNVLFLDGHVEALRPAELKKLGIGTVELSQRKGIGATKSKRVHRRWGEPVELTLYPSKMTEPKDKYQLLPIAEQLTDADAVALYEKAVAAMPKNADHRKIGDQMRGPLDQLDEKQAESTLAPFKQSFELLDQAAKCKKCQWPAVKPPAQPANTSGYRILSQALAVKARLHMARAEYDKATLTLQTGFALGKHIGDGPTVMQGMVGIAIAAIMAKQVEAFVQLPEAPNLYHALAAVPRPLVDVNKGMDAELANLKQFNILQRKAMERRLKTAHEGVRLTMKRMDRQIAALQCIEALRLHAAGHNGEFANDLNELTEVTLPKDPVSDKPFEYRRTGAGAVLKAAAESPKDALQYKLTLKEKAKSQGS